MAIPHRRAVIVLGMHRSGTSAIAGTAIRLGLAPPRTMLPPSSDNPSGFYESNLVASFNNSLLQSAGCDWANCLSFDPARFDAATRAGVSAGTLDIVRREFGNAREFLVKDPRLCVTLPIWLPAFDAAGATVSVLLVIRHPAEVVWSLSRRNGLPDSITAPLWLHHVLEAERLTRSLPRAVVAYDDLMRDWRGCMTHAGRMAGIAWPGGLSTTQSGIDGFLDRSLRHHIMPGVAAGMGRCRFVA
jgi:hypothetical protein